ncbi:MAG: hypothetical protein K2P48_10965, partial [Lachnospiraceae bacterium]|nr:hypothetical protein [Lachnospiraceae bacterium]
MNFGNCTREKAGALREAGTSEMPAEAAGTVNMEDPGGKQRPIETTEGQAREGKRPEAAERQAGEGKQPEAAERQAGEGK